MASADRNPAAAADEAKKPVTIFIWEAYLGTNTLADFTAATGYPTKVEYFDSVELLEKTLLVGRSGYDVVVPAAQPSLPRLIDARVLRPLDKTRLPHFDKLAPRVLAQLALADPGNGHAVPYLGGTAGLGIWRERVRALIGDEPLDSWRLVFAPENARRLAACGIGLVDSAVDVVPTVLAYLAMGPRSESRKDLAAVEQTLSSVRPFIAHYESIADRAIERLGKGEVCISMGYNGDIARARVLAEGAGNAGAIDYVVPKEGAVAWWDTLAIPADAPNPDGAHAFIDFILTPARAAEITNTVHFANAVPESLPLIDEAIRNDPAVYPTAAQEEKLFPLAPVSPVADRSRARMWTKIKSQH